MVSKGWTIILRCDRGNQCAGGETASARRETVVNHLHGGKSATASRYAGADVTSVNVAQRELPPLKSIRVVRQCTPSFSERQTTKHGRFDVAMLTKTLTWLVISLFVALTAWWWLDPVGFSQNPVFTWFKGYSVPLPEGFR